MTLFWSLPFPLLCQAMLKVPAMILGVKSASNQHCIGGGGGMHKFVVFLRKCPKSFIQDCSLHFSYALVPQFRPSYEQSMSVQTRLKKRMGQLGEFFLQNKLRQFIFNCPIKISEIERSIGIGWPKFFCEFDFYQLHSSIKHNRSIKFD